MKSLLVYLRGYWLQSVLGPLFKLLEASFELLVPLVVAAMIDTGIARGDRAVIVRMSLLLVALGALGLLASVTAQYFAAKAATGFGQKLRHALLARIQSLSFAQLDALGTSTLVTRLTSDANQVQTGVNMTLRLLLRSPFIVFGAMIMAFTIDVQGALVFAVAIPALGVAVAAVMVASLPLYRQVQGEMDSITRATRETLRGVRVIRAFGQEEQQTQAFAAQNEALTRWQQRVGRVSALMNPATYTIINAAIAWLLWKGALRVDAGALTPGAVVALYNYMSQILVELLKLASLILTITRAVACGNRIGDVLALTPAMEAPQAVPAPVPGAPVLAFEGVHFRYPGAAEEALGGVTFRLNPGETLGVIGGTGAGKSSLLQLIPRFYDATQGEVLLHGVNVKQYPLAALRARIGLVPQQAALFTGSIRDNLRWGKPDATDAELWEALALAQADEVVRGKGGLNALMEQGGRNLSGGQRQRLTIARALVRKPDVLLLDDSASALDYATDAALRKALRELPGAPALVVVSQRAASLMHAGQILVLEEGQVSGLGDNQTLLQTCAVYREIYESQFPGEAKEHA